MIKACVAIAIVAAPVAASAGGDGFIQGVAGYSSPLAGEDYQREVEGGGARVGLRVGWSPLRIGRSRLGLEGGFDWRPLSLVDLGSAQEFRALIGPRLTFAADAYEVFFRAAVGYDYLDLEGNFNDEGYAFEPGFGAAYRHDMLRFGAEVAVPVTYHPAVSGTGYMDGFTAADIQLTAFVGADLF
jgi:hypothetical protein